MPKRIPRAIRRRWTAFVTQRAAVREEMKPRDGYVTWVAFKRWRRRATIAFVGVFLLAAFGIWLGDRQDDARASDFCQVRVQGETAARAQLGRERKALKDARNQLTGSIEFLAELPEGTQPELARAIRRNLKNLRDDVETARTVVAGAKVNLKAARVPETCYTDGLIERPKPQPKKKPEPKG